MSTENKMSNGAVMSISFISILVILGIYHVFFVRPVLEEAKHYYVVNLEAIMEAKVTQLIEREQVSATPLSEDALLQEASAFRNQLVADLENFSQGAPIFQPNALVRVNDKVLDITKDVAAAYRLPIK